MLTRTEFRPVSSKCFILFANALALSETGSEYSSQFLLTDALYISLKCQPSRPRNPAPKAISFPEPALPLSSVTLVLVPVPLDKGNAGSGNEIAPKGVRARRRLTLQTTLYM